MATKIVTKNSSTASAVPTASDLVQGELAVNVADKRLFTEDNAGAIVELGTNPSGNVTFQDNGKAIFGAGSDLQIYHDGSNSYITDTTGGNFFINDDGAGYLMMKGSDLYFRNTSSADMIHAQSGGFVKLYYNGVEKLATTSTGIDVTGIASVTGSNQHALTIKSDVGTGLYEVGRNQSTGLLEFKGTEATYNGYLFKGPSSDLMTINANGDVGIGISNPSDYYTNFNSLVLGNTSAASGMTIASGTTHDGTLAFADGTSGTAEYSGYIQYSHGTDALSIGTAATERMRIDSSGNVGVGTTSAPSRLTVKSPDNTLATNIAQFDSQNGNAGFKFGYQRIEQIGATVPITFETGGSESMRIDSSGDLIVGGTSSGANDAVSISNTGYIQAIVNGDTVGYFNRRTSDGEILRFQKDGSTVGSIFSGHGGTQVGIGTNTTGITFNPNTRSMMPADPSSTNPQLDATLDIGFSSVRWRDLYLSGGVYLGGTSDAHKLDDYEEVNFTATLLGSGGQPSTLLTVTGFATKIGRVVQYSIGFENVNTTGYAGNFSITGLPFQNNGGRAMGNLVGYTGLTYSGTECFSIIGVGSTNLEAFTISSNSVWAPATHNAGSSRYFWLTGTYMTTA